MSTKNFSLDGIGAKVQYGKKGGYAGWEGGKFVFTASDKVTKAVVSGSAGVASDDFVTVSQLQGASSGINVKLSCRLATNAGIAGGGSGASFTATLGAGDIIESITIDNGGSGYPNDQLIMLVIEGGNPTKSAIAHVISEAAGTINKVIITDNGLGYDSSPTVTTANASWASGSGFDNAPSIIDGEVIKDNDRILVRTEGTGIAGDGSLILLPGAESNGIYQVIDAELGNWIRATDSDENDEILYGDYVLISGGSSNGSSFILSNITSEENPGGTLPTIDQPGNAGYQAWVAFSQAPAYDAKTLGGLALNNGEFELDFNNLATIVKTEVTDVIAIQKASGEHKQATITNVLNSLEIPNNIGTDVGLIHSNGAGVYTTGGITAGIDAEAGINITTGTGPDIVVGLDIAGTTTSTANLTDKLIAYQTDTTDNRAITVESIIELVAGLITTNSIGQGDSYVVVNDTGANGTISFAADSFELATITTANGFVSTSVTASDLIDTAVVFANASGKLTSKGLFAFDSATDTLTVGTATLIGEATGNTTLSTSKADGNIVLATDGAGIVEIQSVGSAKLSAEAGKILALRGDGITLGATNGSDMYVAIDAGTGVDNYFNISTSATGESPIIAAKGIDTDVGIAFVLKGNGTLTVADPGAYDAAVGNASLITKGFLDAALQSAVVPGTQGSVAATVPLTAADTITIIAAGDIPVAGYKITRVALTVTSISDLPTTVEIAGSGVYMTAEENDTQLLGLYVAYDYSTASSGTDITATVANPGAIGQAEVTVEYIVL